MDIDFGQVWKTAKFFRCSFQVPATDSGEEASGRFVAPLQIGPPTISSFPSKGVMDVSKLEMDSDFPIIEVSKAR
jgi:hypothetical protein